MPVVETTVIEGYDAATKARLLKGMTRVVRSVMAAPPDGVVTILREVAASSYARGGVSRVPGPPLPPATELAEALAAALGRGDVAAAAPLVADGFVAVTAEGARLDLAAAAAADAQAGRRYDGFVEALTDDGSLVFGHGRLADGRRFIDRFRLAGPVIADRESW